MIKNDIVEMICERIGGFSQGEIANCVTDILAEMTSSLQQGESVKVTNFGVFEVVERKARIGRNPMTMKEYEITAHHSVRFRPSRTLAASLEESPKKD